MRFSWAKTPTMDEISRVNRGLMCPAVTTGCVPGGVCGGGHCASHRGHCGPEPTNVGDPCGRLAPRVARIHRTPGERSCTGVIETRNRSAWATLRFGANKFNHLSICAREGPLTGFLSFFLYFLGEGEMRERTGGWSGPPRTSAPTNGGASAWWGGLDGP